MELKDYFPIWDKLTAAEKQSLNETAICRHVKKGTILATGRGDCVGLFLVCSGQLRAFMTSDEGKEITFSRLFERDICLLSASCMMASLRFDVTIEAETDSEIYVIPAPDYKILMENSAVIANYTNEIMASRFSDVMWLVEQIMWKSFDVRLAGFLLEESSAEGTDELKITHERIANHMGTAREVVTRMLKYFQSEGMVLLSRGDVKLTDRGKLEALAG